MFIHQVSIFMEGASVCKMHIQRQEHQTQQLALWISVTGICWRIDFCKCLRETLRQNLISLASFLAGPIWKAKVLERQAIFFPLETAQAKSDGYIWGSISQFSMMTSAEGHRHSRGSEIYSRQFRNLLSVTCLTQTRSPLDSKPECLLEICGWPAAHNMVKKDVRPD